MIENKGVGMLAYWNRRHLMGNGTLQQKRMRIKQLLVKIGRLQLLLGASRTIDSGVVCIDRLGARGIVLG